MDKIMGHIIVGASGVAGAALAALFGGWDGAMATLGIFMLIDYITGVILALVFKKSSKTESGALDSRAGLKGLCRKAGMMLIVIVAVRLDILCGMEGILRTGTICALIANESLSIVENIGSMGVPLPAALLKAIERLREKIKDDENKE